MLRHWFVGSSSTRKISSSCGRLTPVANRDLALRLTIFGSMAAFVVSTAACSNNGATGPKTDMTTTAPAAPAATTSTPNVNVTSSSPTATNPAATTSASPNIPPATTTNTVTPIVPTGVNPNTSSPEPSGSTQPTSASPVAPGSTNTSSDSEPVTPGVPAVQFVGRVARDGDQATFAWSGTGVVAAFSGTQVSVQLRDSGTNQFTVLVDNELAPILKPQSGSHAYPLAEGLSEGRHEVAIYRRTEANQGTTTFEGFDFGQGGELLAPPPAKERHLEIVGDSITCGYGNEGADTSCTFSPDTQNHYLTYGAIAARALDAELSTVAWSGKGVVNNYDTDTTNPMPALYNRVLPDDPNSLWDFSVKPDAVVINLGTNDFSTDGDPTTEQFRDGYVGLIGQIRNGAPDALILCTNGNMLSGADLDAARAGIHAAVEAVRAAGDTKVVAWDMNVANDSPGCDWHPDLAAHQLMADALVAQLKQHLGW